MRPHMAVIYHINENEIKIPTPEDSSYCCEDLFPFDVDCLAVEALSVVFFLRGEQ
jgi:hypothetical protein